LIGSVFVPLFGVLGADLVRTRRSRRASSPSAYSSHDSVVRGRAFLGWVAGVVTYHWIAPSGPSWWIDAVSSLFGTPLGERYAWLAASIPAFVVAFAVTVLVEPRQRAA
jgi:hypothetical protein